MSLEQISLQISFLQIFIVVLATCFIVWAAAIYGKVNRALRLLTKIRQEQGEARKRAEFSK